MKKISLLSLIFCLVMSSMSFASSPIVFPQEEAVKTELIVSVVPSGEARTRSQVTESVHSGFTIEDAIFEELSTRGRFEDTVTLVDRPEGNIYLVSYSERDYRDFESAKAGVTAYFENRGYRVESVDKNAQRALVGAPVYDYKSILSIHNKQKPHYDLINLSQAWQVTTGSSDVKVAVLDTGIDHNHVALKNHVDRSLGMNYTTNDATDTMDRVGHGTHVAGTIGAYGPLSGVMQQVTLMPIKVLGDNGKGDVYGEIKGIYYAVAKGADVINMSLGDYDYIAAEKKACDYASSKGVVVVAATGNLSKKVISYPAGYASVIAVGSVDADKTKSWFTDHGDGLELMAPGASIYSTKPGNKAGYDSGTSMATPHVAGIVGLMRAVNPNITVNEVRQILRDTAENLGPAFEYGHGLVDAEAAVTAASR